MVILPCNVVYFASASYMHIKYNMFTIGTILAFGGYLYFLWSPVEQLVKIPLDFAGASASLSNIFKYLDMPVESEGEKELGRDKGWNIEYTNVGFSYDGEKEILKDVSLKVESGQKMAVVGVSGSGKTTMTKLLTRLYDPCSGYIYINGTNTSEVKLEALRENIGIVEQEAYLFDTTVLENLKYARSGVTDEEIVETAKKAQIHDFIMSLPEGYDTVVGDRGVRLSGGQRQRLLIARALLKDPGVLIFDEPTSALDTLTEAALWEAINSYFRDKTVIIITHRLSTIKDANRIAVMAEGRISEFGTHEELLGYNGLYAAMYNQQRVTA